MKKQQIVSAVSVLMNRGQDDNTGIFTKRNHDSMVRELQNYIEMNKSHLGGNVILNFTQAMNDHGVDLILEIPDRVKIGFQIKSHYDVSEDNFAANVKRQFAESFAHGLDKWILIICAPLHDGKRNWEPRIAHLINEMSMFKTNMFAIYNPRHAAALFQQMNALSDTDFNAEYQKLANIEESEAETLKLLQKLLNTEDQSTAKSYLSRRSIATATPPKTLSKMNAVLNWNLSEDELKGTLDSCLPYLKRLESLTPQSREFLTGFLERAEPSDGDEKMRALCRDVENHLRSSTATCKKEIEVLARNEMAYYDKNWDQDTFVSGNVGVGWPIVVSLVEFARHEQISLDKIFSEMNFSLLD